MLKQLSQPSTWRGIVMALTSIGIAVRPELMEQIVVAGTGIAGAIGILLSDK
jgi:hypothetical protein